VLIFNTNNYFLIFYLQIHTFDPNLHSSMSVGDSNSISVDSDIEGSLERCEGGSDGSGGAKVL